MFTNYYKLMNISPNASDEEIIAAIEQCKLSPSLLEEIKMVLQNKSLKGLYDAEVKIYEASESKQDYEINDPVLERELKKLRAYISNKARSSVPTETEEPKKSSNTWLWILVFLLVGGLGKCMSSYHKGRALEENRQKYLRGDYDNISVNRPAFDITHFFNPFLK